MKRDPNEPFARDTHPELPLDPDVVRPGAYRWPLHITPFLAAAVFAGGCLGTLCRYGASLILPDKGVWPISTLAVNLLGAFLLGFLLEALARSGPDQGRRRAVRLGAGTGFMGAFTTYSALAVETDLLVRGGNPGPAIVYMIVSVLGGIILAGIGIQAAGLHRRRKGGKA